MVWSKGGRSVAWLRFQLGVARFSDKIFEYSRTRNRTSFRSYWMVRNFYLMEMVFHGFECSMMLVLVYRGFESKLIQFDFLTKYSNIRGLENAIQSLALNGSIFCLI